MFDAYFHTGRTRYEPWPTVARDHCAAGIDGGLLVHHFGDVDNAYLLEGARRLGPRYRCVVLADPNAPAWPDELTTLAAHKRVVGVRVMARSGCGWQHVARVAGDVGLDVFVFVADPIATVASALVSLASSVPVRIVLTHLGASPGHPPDLNVLNGLADVPNLVLGFSGFHMWATDSSPEVRQIAESLPEPFGGRIVWGSNYPLCGVGELYLRLVERFRSDPWGLGAAVTRAVGEATASSLWCGDVTASRHQASEHGLGAARHLTRQGG